VGPSLVSGTQRSHYGQAPGNAYETFGLNPSFYPEACDGGSTYTDPEVLLVSSPSAGRDSKVYWNLETSD
jgi:hypothetical protein